MCRILRRRTGSPAIVCAALLGLAAVLVVAPGFATIGAAEWQTTTPGGNRIQHLDPLKAKFGTCLIGSRDDGVSPDRTEVYVAHIRWWQVYRSYIAGQTDFDYFLFDEISRSVTRYESLEALRTHARQRSGGGPISAPLTGP
jgi:hypothetical protein